MTVAQRPKALTKLLVKDPTDAASVADALHRVQDQMLAVLNPTLRNPVVASSGTASPLTTKGDLYGHSTVDARVPVGSDGTVLTADSTQALGVKWAAASGGSAPWSLATKPAVADSLNEEFEGADTLGSTWTDNNGLASATAIDINANFSNAWRRDWNSHRASWLILQGGSDNKQYGISKTFTASVGDFIYIRFMIGSFTSTTAVKVPSIQLQVYDTATGTKYADLSFNAGAGTPAAWVPSSDSTAATVLLANSAVSPGVIPRAGYAGLYKTSATTWDAYVFDDAGSHNKIATLTTGAAFTAATLLIAMQNNSGTSCPLVGFDFVRRTNSTTWPFP